MSSNQDDLYEKAKIVAKGTNWLSISLLQRTFMIGYNRASRLMDSMIEDGMVEKYETERGIGYRIIEKSEANK